MAAHDRADPPLAWEGVEGLPVVKPNSGAASPASSSIAGSCTHSHLSAKLVGVSMRPNLARMMQTDVHREQHQREMAEHARL